MTDTAAAVQGIARRLLEARQTLATAESCTGGLVATLCTDLAGSSGWFERGLITYSNRAKQELLGVPAELLQRHGAVSRECALAMAAGVLVHAPVDWGLAITGIAGPGGGSPEKPVGLVWVAWARRGGTSEAQRLQLEGSRDTIRRASAAAALQGLLERLGGA